MKVREFNNKIIKKIIQVFSFCLYVSLFLVVFMARIDQFVWRTDIVSFITGARIVRFGEGENLYDLSVQQKHQSIVTKPNKLILLPYRNLPLLASFYIPLTYISLYSAYQIYALVLIVFTTFISWFSTRVFENLKNSYWFILPFAFYPTLSVIFYGQNSTFLVLAFMSIYYYLRKDKPFIVGIILGLLFLKIQYILCLPYVCFLLNKKPKFFKGLFISTLFVFLGSIYISGFGFFEEYIRMLIKTESPVYGTKATTMFPLFSSMSQILPLAKQYLLIINMAFYVLSIWLFSKNHYKFSLQINFAILALLTLVFCIHGGYFDMALLIVPLWLLIDIYKGSNNFNLENILVIFIIIFSSLFLELGLSFAVPFLFLLSVALLFNKSNLLVALK